MQNSSMNPKKNRRPQARLVVATAHTAAGLRQAGKLGPGDVGFVEVRLDALGSDRRRLHAALPSIRPRILLTARHPGEGGAGRLSAGQRRELLQEFLFVADAVDVELRSASSMQPLLEAAQRGGTTTVVSFHNFARTPGLPRLRDIVRRSSRAGADIVKIATQLRSAGDLASLLLLQSSAKVPLATMGMGPLGKVSRLVLAAAGSRLNYGYLDKPQVSGQWPALELVDRLGEIMT